MRWEDLYDELYDADDRAEIERLKTRLLACHRSSGARRQALTSLAYTLTRSAAAFAWSLTSATSSARCEAERRSLLGAPRRWHSGPTTAGLRASKVVQLRVMSAELRKLG